MDRIYCWHFVTEDDVFQRKRIFNQILHDGVLKSHTYLRNPKIQQLDILAGDDEYIFLGLSHYGIDVVLDPIRDNYHPKLMGEYGFGFDATELINNGALVRNEDFLREYEHITLQTLRDYTDYSTCPEMYDADIMELLETYDLLGAANEEMQRFAADNSLYGRDALEYIEEITDDCFSGHCEPFFACELLYPEILPLNEFCIFMIENGHIRTCGIYNERS